MLCYLVFGFGKVFVCVDVEEGFWFCIGKIDLVGVVGFNLVVKCVYVIVDFGFDYGECVCVLECEDWV